MMRSGKILGIVLTGTRIVSVHATLDPYSTPCGLLTCHHGSTCESGPLSIDEHIEDGSYLFLGGQPEGADYHCECAARYTGVECTIPYQKCGERHKCL